MNNPSRINIEQRTVNKAADQTLHDVTVKVMLSLFDVPHSVDTKFDKEARIFRLIFDYIGDEEPSIKKQGDPAVSLLVGKNSGRLYEIDIAIDQLEFKGDNSKYELVIDVAENSVKHHIITNPEASRSFEAVNRIFKNYSSELKPAIEQAMTV